jgi:hypothetical protein
MKAVMFGLKYLLKSALATLAYVFVVMSFILLVLIALSAVSNGLRAPYAAPEVTNVTPE